MSRALDSSYCLKDVLTFFAIGFARVLMRSEDSFTMGRCTMIFRGPVLGGRLQAEIWQVIFCQYLAMVSKLLQVQGMMGKLSRLHREHPPSTYRRRSSFLRYLPVSMFS